MSSYMTANEAAQKWNISHRRVITLCNENRIANVTKLGSMWMIPFGAEKPIDARSLRYNKSEDDLVKPFLKWAGGKGQLLKEIEKYYPFNNTITKYAEPFVGGGAVLFDVLNKFDLDEIYISDINAELINAYIIIKENVYELIELLSRYQTEFTLLDLEERKNYYLTKRERFNKLIVLESSVKSVEKAAIMIFLNKTCFNGLYRVNKKGYFNVPIGSYKNPMICDNKNLEAVSKKLQKVNIACKDYRKSKDFIDEHTFVYFDPPYRALTQTAGFTDYNRVSFDDAQQIALSNYVDVLDKKGAKILVSNSDPKNANEDDDFFDAMYSNYKIRRVDATRMINCNAKARGKIKELIICNF